MIEESMGNRGLREKGNSRGESVTKTNDAEGNGPTDWCESNDDYSTGRRNDDGLVYATIDSLALRRARLPLKLLPIDQSSDLPTMIINDNNKGENESEQRIKVATITSRRGFSPRRPIYKVRPGLAVTGQWKCRGRSRSQQQQQQQSVGVGKNISREILEDATRRGNRETSEASNERQSNEVNRGIREINCEPSRSIVSSVGAKEGSDRVEDEKIAPGEEAGMKREEDSGSGNARSDRETGEKTGKDPRLETERKIGERNEPLSLTSKILETSIVDKRTTTTATATATTGGYRPELTFAKNVLRYVPMSRRARRHNKTGNGLSSNKKRDKSPRQASGGERIKSSMTRKELRRVSISLPTNFVHLSSATTASRERFDLTDQRDKGCVCVKISREESGGNFIPVAGQQGEIESRGVEIQGAPEVVKISENVDKDESRDNAGDSSTFANPSFLWGRSDRPIDQIGQIGQIDLVKTNSTNDVCSDDAYDDVGPLADTEEYDDVVGPLSGIGKSIGTLLEEMSLVDEDQLYDDVLVGKEMGRWRDEGETSDSSASSFEKIYGNGSADRQERDDDPYLSIGNDYSSVEDVGNVVDVGEEGLDGTYDDVQLPSQDRVNSLYAGGSLNNNKESEWEDFEEQVPFFPNDETRNAGASSRNATESRQNSTGKRRTVQRWSRRVRREKSSRGNAATTGGRSTTSRNAAPRSVAVSLGTGSVLLVGTSTNEHRGESPPTLNGAIRARSTNATASDTEFERPTSSGRGLVQLRILGRRDEDSVDTQETSCYILEDTASDDSNYETLLYSSFPSDEFSSDDEDSTGVVRPTRVVGSRVTDPVVPRAPSRSVPAPPRESSLTETLGRRMKMLRRTWSITKGSLGRMRAAGIRGSRSNVDNNPEDRGNKSKNFEQPPVPANTNNDGRKYFSFKKHFGKSISGLSTFYLETNADERLSSCNNNRTTKEQIYTNSSSESNWYGNTEYLTSNRNAMDDYGTLDEEPLYQFYAAAAARVAFDSDSEGYEEVQDPMPSAAELAKPGHRTLWCQTPRVTSGTLLQRLTPDEKKCQEAKFEILTSEASYLNSLRVLVDEFLNNHDLVHEVLTPSEREKLFGGVPSVLSASERLLGELETVWRKDVMLAGLPELLSNYAKRSSSIYVSYCSNQVSIDATLKELRGTSRGSKFVDTVTRIESHPACQSLSLHSFLMLPMQRVTRLPLLADAVLSKLSTDKSKEERKRWELALSRLSRVVTECNEGARTAGRLAEMEALERKLEYSGKVPPPIVLRDRYLVRRGPVVQILPKSDADNKLTFGKKYHKASLYLLLLTDYLLIAKPKSSGTNEETYAVVDTCKRSLVALEKVTEDSPFAGRNAMVLTLLENYSGRHVEYIICCNGATERERWLDAVEPPKPILVGESLYETWDCPQVTALYPYAAAQPDELTLQPGDVMNVLRKMPDGWHLGEKLLGGEQGWFPGNYAREVASEHVRARNLRQRHRLLALSTSVLQQRAKHTSR